MFSCRQIIRIVCLAGLSLFLMGGALALAQGEYGDNPSVYIDITQGQGRLYGIVITDLLPIKAGGRTDRYATYVPERLGKNLGFTGLFKGIDRRTALEADPRSGLDSGSDLDYGAWRAVGADFLVKGGMESSGSKITLEMRLFDVAAGRQMIGKRYSGPAKDITKMVSKFTNAMLEAITTQPGWSFGSEIIFVTGDKSNRSIMMTELGGDEATSIAGPKNGPNGQPTMGPGGKTAWVHRNGKSWELLVNGKVVSSGPTHISPAFKPDGGVVAAVSGPDSTNIVAFSGRSKTPLTSVAGIAVSPTFSPDGRMAYVSDQSGSAQIYIDGAQATSGAKATDPAWSPKGDKIAFVSRETDICVMSAAGGGIQPLTGGQGANRRPSFSPDGRMIVFESSRGGSPQLYVMTAEGAAQQPLIPEVGISQYTPYWCPTMPEEMLK